MTGSPYPPNPRRDPDEESTRKLVRRPTRAGAPGEFSDEVSRSPDPTARVHPGGVPGVADGGSGSAVGGRARTPGASWRGGVARDKKPPKKRKFGP